MEKKFGIIILACILLSFVTVKAQFGQCEDSPLCDNSFSTYCACQSTETGTQCYIHFCKDLDNDGCLELDYSSGTRCFNDCEQISKYTWACETPTGCDGCDGYPVGKSMCVGGYPDPFGGGSTVMKTCKYNRDTGCSFWDYEDCPPSQQCIGESCQYVIPQPDTCRSDCSLGETRCVMIVQDDYRELCENWDDDSCFEWWSDANPQMTGYGLEYCRFGCKDSSKGDTKSAVCMYKPEEKTSDCALGDYACQGKDMIACVECEPNYNTFLCNNTYNVTKCQLGCIDKGGGNILCKDESYLLPKYNKTHFGVINSSTVPRGMAFVDNHFVNADNNWPLSGFYLHTYDYDFNEISRDNVSVCSNFTNAVSYVASYNNDFYILSGSDGIGQYSSDGYCIKEIVDTGTDKIYLNEPLAITENYIYTSNYLVTSGHATEGESIYRFDKETGEYIDTYTWPDSNIEAMAGSGYYLFVQDSNSGILKSFTEDFKETGVEINLTKITGDAGWWDLVVDNSNKMYLRRAFNIIEFDYIGGVYLRDDCSLGDKKCSPLMYISGSWIRPYLLNCGLFDDDPYYEWAEALNYTHVTGTGQTCQYGCVYNETLQVSECRNTAQADCTNLDWKCTPDTWKCDNGWRYKCVDTGRNCFNWDAQYKCDNDCFDDKVCKACVDECSSGESKCFNDGFSGIDELTRQSVAFPFPVTVNCSYSFNQKCWEWDIQQVERCPLGCFENETSGFCYTQKDIDDVYHISNYSSAISQLFWEVGETISSVFPSQTHKYTFSSGIVLAVMIIVSYYSSKLTGDEVKRINWEIGVFSGVMLALILSLNGWLPIYVTVLIIVASAYAIGKKLFGAGESGE